MPKRKGKINLTIAKDARERAEKLAERERRSLSTLFEKLIDEEWERTGGTAEKPSQAYGPEESEPAKETPPSPPDKKKIGFTLKTQPLLEYRGAAAFGRDGKGRDGHDGHDGHHKHDGK